MIDALGKSLKGALDAQGFAAVAGAAPGPAQVKFGLDPADTWSDGSYIGTPEWPREKPGDSISDSASGSIQSLVTDLLSRQGNNAGLLEQGKDLTSMATVQNGLSVIQNAQQAMQTVQQVKSVVQGEVTGLPQLASATSLLDAASKTGLLPTLPPVPTFTPPQNSLKNPGLPMGEMLS